MSRFRTLDEWLRWQEGLHPKKIDLGLERVASVWRKAAHRALLPFRVITVAGTNGKGSCVAFLDAIYRAAGYRVGCFTSPHLVNYNERIRVDGKAADDELICAAFERIDQARGGTSITYFEFSALAALSIFLDAQLDVVVLEVGMGGRLDAVNILDPDLALVTTIGLDHTEWLGSTLHEIAREKAGIMRSGKPVVCASPSASELLFDHARRLHAAIYVSGIDFSYRNNGASWDWWREGRRMEELPLPCLQGEYQLQNAAGVIMALTLMQSWLAVERGAVEQGLQAAQVRGRFQVIPGTPGIVLDVAHNVEAVQVFVENLRRLPRAGQTKAVFGMMSDKDVKSVVAVVAPLVDEWYLADLGVSRGMPTARLSEIIAAVALDNVKITQYSNAVTAFEGAMADASAGDTVLVFGSFWLVGDILPLVERKQSKPNNLIVPAGNCI